VGLQHYQNTEKFAAAVRRVEILVFKTEHNALRTTLDMQCDTM
jgi:hypothetical protein